MRRFTAFVLFSIMAGLSVTGEMKAQGAVTDSVTMGALYANEVYYSMSSGVVSTHSRDTWDIAFRTMKMSSSILINDGKGVVLYTYPKSDTSGWAAMDTSGLSAWNPMYNDPNDWENGAFSRYALGYPDYGWCLYNPVTHDLVGDSLFIIKLRDGSFRKLWMVRKESVLDKYVFRYANLDGTQEQDILLDCNPYIAKDFVGFNLETNAIEDFQPDKTLWDVVFTKYMSVQPNGMPYPVTGALVNSADKEKEFWHVPLTYTGYNAGTWDSTRSSIGYDWKFVDNNYVYHVQDSLVYFVQDMSRHIFKLYFTYFAGSSTGQIAFVSEQMTGLGVPVRNGNEMNVSVFPNPASELLNVFLSGTVTGTASLVLTDLSGKGILAVPAFTSEKTLSIPVGNMSPGIYLLKVTSGENSILKKFIISR